MYNNGLSDVANLAKQLKLFEEDRVNTFVSWKFSENEKCSVSEMAKAGFYFCGDMNNDDDSAICFLCGKVLDGWENTDDPWIEHTKHSANCKFVQMRRCEDDLTVEEMLELCKHVIKQSVIKSQQKKEGDFKKIADKIRSIIQNQQF